MVGTLQDLSCIEAYLEKQKEPIDPFDTKLFQDGVKEGRRLEREDMKKEQQPAEWSEKDKLHLNNAILATMSDWGVDSDTSRWLKSLPERFSLQPKQEWSEDDEKMVRFYEADYNNQIGDMPMIDVINMRLEFKNWLTNRLKFIRPQSKQNVNDMIITPNKEFFQWIYDRLVNVHNENPNVDYMISFKRRIEELSFDEPSWKPSEEQMKALYCALNDAISLYSDKVSPLYEEISRTHFDALESLYNDLKKL